MWGVGPGNHPPLAAFVRVPAQRQLDQHPSLGPVQVGAGMVSRTHHIIDLQLLDVDLLAGGVQLPAALEIFSIPDSHRIVAVGEGVIILGGFRVILDRVRRNGLKE